MPDLPALTLFLGPQTRLGLALNALVRVRRGMLEQAGVTAIPSRLATPAVRQALDAARPVGERREALNGPFDGKPRLLSAVNIFGPPRAAFSNGELFPDVEAALAGLAEVTGTTAPRIVLTLDRLANFILAANSAPLAARVKATPWEVLYELSWADLVAEIRVFLPDSEILVLTPHGAAVSSQIVLGALFGDAAAVLPDAHALLRASLNTTGHAVLDRMQAQDTGDPGILEELYTSFAETPDPAMIEAVLGIDKVTAALLDQRFEDDLRTIAALDRVRVI